MPPGENDELLQRLQAIFQVEAAEHLKNMSSQLEALARAAPGESPAPLLESLFREVHSLKGAARAVNLGDVEAVCMGLESSLAALKRQPPDSLPADWFAGTYRVIDELDGLLAGNDADRPPPASPRPPGTAPPERFAAPPATPSSET